MDRQTADRLIALIDRRLEQAHYGVERTGALWKWRDRLEQDPASLPDDTWEKVMALIRRCVV
jgi:hypothetical protein